MFFVVFFKNIPVFSSKSEAELNRQHRVAFSLTTFSLSYSFTSVYSLIFINSRNLVLVGSVSRDRLTSYIFPIVFVCTWFRIWVVLSQSQKELDPTIFSCLALPVVFACDFPRIFIACDVSRIFFAGDYSPYFLCWRLFPDFLCLWISPDFHGRWLFADFLWPVNCLCGQEEQNRGKPNWEHLNDELHVLITVEDCENRAKLKMERAVEEVKKLLTVVSFRRFFHAAQHSDPRGIVFLDSDVHSECV